jgi:hypothetical protein
MSSPFFDGLRPVAFFRAERLVVRMLFRFPLASIGIVYFDWRNLVSGGNGAST